MELPIKGEFLIAMEEGIVPTRYRDKAGVDTWGIGHTAAAGAPDPRQMSFAMPTNVDGAVTEAIRLFRRDLDKYTQDVIRNFGPMAPHELAGWVSWHFNTGGAHSSRARGLWKAGDKKGAVRVLRSWNKFTSNGVKLVSAALDKRRGVEADLILRGRYPDLSAGLPVWATNGQGRVIWRPLDLLSLEEYERAAGLPPVPQKSRAPFAEAVAALGIGLVIFWDNIKEFFAWLM